MWRLYLLVSEAAACPINKNKLIYAIIGETLHFPVSWALRDSGSFAAELLYAKWGSVVYIWKMSHSHQGAVMC